jgi:hypothetical protein
VAPSKSIIVAIVIALVVLLAVFYVGQQSVKKPKTLSSTGTTLYVSPSKDQQQPELRTHVIIVDALGTVVAQAIVVAVNESPEGSHETVEGSAHEGKAVLDLGAGTWTLWAISETKGIGVAESCSIPTSGPVRITIGECNAFKGRVIDEYEVPLPNTLITVMPSKLAKQESIGHVKEEMITDDTGAFSSRAVACTMFAVSARHPQYEPQNKLITAPFRESIVFVLKRIKRGEPIDNTERVLWIQLVDKDGSGIRDWQIHCNWKYKNEGGSFVTPATDESGWVMLSDFGGNAIPAEGILTCSALFGSALGCIDVDIAKNRGNAIRLELFPPRALKGKVVDANEVGVAAAIVALKNNYGYLAATTVCDISGGFEVQVPPGDYVVEVNGGLKGGSRQNVTINEESKDLRLILRLNNLKSVCGTVVGPDKQFRPHANVTVRGASSISETKTITDGSFGVEVSDNTAATYVVEAQVGDLWHGRVGSVTPGAMPITVILSGPVRVLKGTVTDSVGRSIPEAKLRIFDVKEARFQSRIVERTRADGTFELRDVKGETIVIVAFGEAGFGSTEITNIQDGVTNGINVILAKGSTVEVQVVDSSGQAAPNCIVSMRSTSDASIGFEDATDSQGNIVLSQVPPGEYKILVASTGLRESHEETFIVGGSPVTLHIKLSRLKRM